MTDFAHSLDRALAEIDKPHWQAPLSLLADRFDDYPFDEITINEELLDMLWGLKESHHRDPNVPLTSFAAIRMAKFICWTMRAFNLGDEGHFAWNPLEESYSDFRHEKTKTLQASTAHPAEDIIKRWCVDHLK